MQLQLLVVLYLVMVHKQTDWYVVFGILKSNDCGSYSGFSDHRLKLENGAVHTVEMKPLKDVYLDTQKFSEDYHCKFDFSKHDDVTFQILQGEINGDSCIDQQVMKIVIQLLVN